MKMASLLPSVIFPLLFLLISNLETPVAQSIGVCNGRNGGNLPSEADVVALYKSKGITRMRIYDPNRATLEALRGSNIELIVDIFKGNLESLNDAGKASEWVQNNIKAFPDVKFRYIAVGNEVHPNDSEAKFVLPAMRNIHNALSSANLQGQIKVSTAIDTKLHEGYPPANGVFSGSANSHITPIIRFLAEKGSPLLANIYPYFAYINKQAGIQLPYALFTSPGVVVHDPANPRANKFKYVGLPDYDMNKNAFDKANVTGGLGYSSSQLPCDIEEERDIEDRFVYLDGRPSDADEEASQDYIRGQHFGDKRTGPSSGKGRGRKKGRLRQKELVLL